MPYIRVISWPTSISATAMKWAVIVIVALFAALVLIAWWKGFNWFPDYSQWTWLSLAAVWGFLGLWLLESKESPFLQQQFQGWLGDRGTNWGWLQPALYNTFSLLAELGVVVLALGA